MPEVKIERLVLQACGMDAEAAKRLAQAVAAGIERAGLAADLPQRLELVRLQVPVLPGATTGKLAQQILEQLARELGRS